MPEEPLGVILRCAVECDKATAGLKELHKKAIKATKIPPIQPPVIPTPKIPKPEMPKIEIPKEAKTIGEMAGIKPKDLVVEYQLKGAKDKDWGEVKTLKFEEGQAALKEWLKTGASGAKEFKILSEKMVPRKIKPPEIPKPVIPKPEIPKVVPIKPEIPKPPEVPKIEAPKIEAPVVPKAEVPKVEPSKIPELYMPDIKPIKIKPEIDIVKPSKALETMKKAVEEDTLAMRDGFKKLGTPMEDSEEQVRRLSKSAGEDLPRDWRKGFEAAGKAALSGLGPTQMVSNAAEKLGRILGIDVPKVTEKGAMQQIKMYRWIGRDLIRLGRMTGKVGQRIQGVFSSMIQNSVALGSVVDDLRYAYEELTSELGEALAPVLEPLVDLVWAFTDWFLEQPNFIKQVVGALILFGMILMKVVPFLMIFRGYLLLNRFSLMQAAAASKQASVATTRFGRATQRTSRIMKKFGKTLKFSTPLIAGVGAAFMTIQTGGNLAEAASWGLMSAGMMMMMILPTWGKLIGALVTGLGALVGWLSSSKEEADKIPSSLIKLMNEMEYTEEDAYSLGEQIMASFRMANDSYQEIDDSFRAFTYRMEELGFEGDEITRMWEAMGGKIEGVIPPVEDLNKVFQTLPASAQNAMFLIRAAFDDGKITQEEWEFIVNTPAWEAFEKKFPAMAGHMIDNAADALIDGKITSSEWDAILDIWYFGGSMEDMYNAAVNMWIRYKAYLGRNIVNLGDYLEPWDEIDLDIPEIDLRDYLTTLNWGKILGEYREFFFKSTEYFMGPFESMQEAIISLQGVLRNANYDWRDWKKALMDYGHGLVNLQDIINKIDTGRLEDIPEILKALQFDVPVAEIIRSIPGLKTAKTGGYVTTGGLLEVHPDEWILPAGYTPSVSNTYYITATIREESDIRSLAEELSKLQQEEYRRA